MSVELTPNESPPLAFNYDRLPLDTVARFSQNFNASKANRIARNAVANGDVMQIAFNRDTAVRHDMTFSHEITSGEITSQKNSGRCWLFAALNLLRLEAMEKMNVKTFELSQNYLMFWDKLEKANYFLENILATLDESIDSRILMWLLSGPVQDGGQWDMFKGLVKKYGVVPKSVMPESFSSGKTPAMNAHLTEKLREFAAELRAMHKAGKALSVLREQKTAMLETIYRILAIHNGTPPTSFSWAWRDKDEAYHCEDEALTPTQFYDKFIGLDLTQYVSLLHCPTADKPFNRTYTLDYLGSTAEDRILYLNIEMADLKKYAVEQLTAGKSVWFGCDVGKKMHRKSGLLDEDNFELDLLYDTEFGMDKGTRVTYGQSKMTHAMLFTGVHLEGGKPTKWKVENSWGKESGREGFLIMSDAWFDEYMFQVVVPRASLSKEHQTALALEPIALRPWDPMGALA